MNEKITFSLALPQDNAAFQTEYIQQALNACRDADGGEVILQAGDWHIASLRLYSGTTLRLLAGAHLIASNRWQDYTDFHLDSTLGYLHSPYVIKAWNLPPHYLNSPITAFEAEDVAVIGEEGSLIDGSDCLDPAGEENFRGPMGMVFCKCRNVTLQGYTYQNAANWCHQLDSCTNVHIKSVTILGGHDGVNIHHCVNVKIESCDFQTGDDCIAGYNAENVLVRDCSLNTSCNSFRIGARNLLVQSCRFWGPGVYPHRVSKRHNSLCCFEYYAMIYDKDIRSSNNWLIQDCSFENIDSFLHYNYGGDWMHSAAPLQNISLQNLRIEGLSAPSAVCTQPDAPLTIMLENVTVSWRNGQPPENTAKIPNGSTLFQSGVTLDRLPF